MEIDFGDEFNAEEEAKRIREARLKDDMAIEKAELTQSSYSVSLASQSRFAGLDWAEPIKRTAATLVGAGGIGSYTAFGLCRAGIGSLTIWDGDTIDSSNLSGQLYREIDIGRYKVNAIKDIISLFVPNALIIPNLRFFEENDPLQDITITGLDSMKARRLVFEEWYKLKSKSNNKSRCLFIDARMSVEHIQIFCFRLSSHNRLNNYMKECLFSDDEFQSPACSLKATSHIGMGIGYLITSIVTNHILFENNDVVFDKTIPFYIMADSCRGFILKTANSWEKPKREENS